MMRSMLALGVATAALMAATPGEAFGLRTHLYIAEQVLADLDDCIVVVGDTSAAVPDRVCKAVQENPGYFLAGAIGPDAFPDLLIGQNYVHPGTPDGRQTADWLEHVIDAAESKPEIAFAYGQLIHAAGDSFAHSYVNNYAGGVFELTARWGKDVELRHFRLEKYIDQHLEYDAPLETLRVPSGLLVRTMVETPYLPGDVNLTEADIRALTRNPNSAAGRAAGMVGAKVAKAVPASHMTAMWAMLTVTRLTAKKVVCEDIDAAWTLAAAWGDYAQAEAAARGQTLDWTPDERRVVDCADDDAAQAELDRAEADLVRADALHAKVQFHDAAVNTRDAWLRSLDVAVRQRVTDTHDAYETAYKAREKTRAVAAFAPKWRDDVRQAVEAYMEASLASARLMVANSEPFPPAEHRRRSSAQPYKDWWDCYGPVFQGEPIEAARALCARKAALGVDESLPNIAFQTGIGRGPRSVLLSYLEFGDWLSEIGNEILLGIVRPANPAAVDLGKSMLNPERITREKLNEAFRSGSNGELIFRCVADDIDVDLGMLTPLTERQLAEIRRDRPGEDPFNQPCRPRVHRGDGTAEFFNPRDFVPLQHAITLGKLALVGRDGVRQLAVDLGGSAPPRQSAAGPNGEYSVILEMARSLDGSQPWQTVSMPTPRRAQMPAEPQPDHGSGFPAEPPDEIKATLPLDPVIDRARPGFPFYQTLELRQTAFTALFSHPYEGQILQRREFRPDWYPFKPCPGDPFRPYDGRGPDPRTPLCPYVRTPAQRALDDATEALDIGADLALAEMERRTAPVRSQLEAAWRSQVHRCRGEDVEGPFRWQSGCLRSVLPGSRDGTPRPEAGDEAP